MSENHDQTKKPYDSTRRRELAKQQWANVSPEERKRRAQAHSEAMKARYAAMSPEARAAHKAARQAERKKYFEKMTPERKQQLDQHMKDMNKKYWENITPEELEARSKHQSEWSLKMWQERDQETKDRILKAWREGNDAWYENLPDEEKEKIKERLWFESVGYWASLTEDQRKQIGEERKQREAARSSEEKEEIGRKISEALHRRTAEEWAEHGQRNRDRYNALTEEQKAAYAQFRKDWWAATSDEYKQWRAEISSKRWKDMSAEERARLGQMNRDRWDAMSPEEKAAWAERSRQNQINYWERMNSEERRAAEARLTKMSHDFWDHISDEERARIRSIANRNVNGNNKLHHRFEEAFANAVVSKNYHLVNEVPTSVGNETHHWDYGIYDTNDQLVMVVDLDGAYYHADNCEYDGIHSQEERDESRSLSIPDGVKYCVVHELKFAQSFENLVKQLMIDYPSFIDGIFKMCRSMPIPTPKYSDVELIKSYQKLQRMNCSDDLHRDISLNTRLGDHLVQHFHESIWSAHVKGKPSPHEAWYKDDLLKKVIRNRTIYQTTLNPNKILQGFNVSKVAPKVSVFSAGRAKMIIHRYLNDFDTIFDPFSGFSGRMLGTVSLGKDYLGQDISEIHVRESNQIIDFLRSVGFNINAEIEAHNILQSYGTYPCLFTCPPYGDKEQWLEVPVDGRTCDDWIDICLDHFKCHRYVFVVDHTEKYKDYIVDEIKSQSHLAASSEYIINIDR